MSKKLIITSKQFQQLLSEEMGIADEVTKVSQLIEKEIFGHNYQDFKKQITTDKTDVMLDVIFRKFLTKEAYYEWLQNSNRQDGYSKGKNTIYLSVIKIGKEYNVYNLFDTIQHEVEHYWQTKSSGKQFGNQKYEAITRGMYTSDPVLFDICKMLYYSNKIEIMAYINGTYNAATHKKKKYSDVFEFLKDNSINDVYSFLKNGNKKIEKIKNAYLFNAMYFLKTNKIIPENYEEEDLFRFLQKTVNTAYDYLLRKVAKCYALYVSRLQNEENQKTLGKINLLKSFDK